MLVKVFQKLGGRFARPYHEVQEVEAGEHGIPFRNMPAKAIASAFLAANHGVLFHHHGGDILETHRRFVDRYPENVAEGAGPWWWM